MPKVSFIQRYGERMELQEARGELPRRLELPLPEYVDGLHSNIFREAQVRLGLEDLVPDREDGEAKLVAPAGFMFRLTGAFTLWPDGNDIAWGYGPPADSYEEWRRRHQ